MSHSVSKLTVGKRPPLIVLLMLGLGVLLVWVISGEKQGMCGLVLTASLGYQ